MSIEKWNDEVTEGKVIIVRQPHQMPYQVTEFYDLKDALEAYSDGYFKMPSLNEQIKDGQLDIEYDKEFIEKIKNNLKEAGIDENTPYYEVEKEWLPEYKYKHITKENELKILSDVVADDMHAGHVFIAEKGMTNLEFAEEIFRWTRGHNEPSFESIAIKLFDTDELSLFRNAIENDDKEEFEELLKNKKELINVHDEYGRTPLMNAVLCNDIEKVQQLIKNGANIDDFERNYNKWSKDSLSIAFFNDKKEIFQELLKAGANPYNENKSVHNYISLYEQLQTNNYKNKDTYLDFIKKDTHLIYLVDTFKHDILKEAYKNMPGEELEDYKNKKYINFMKGEEIVSSDLFINVIDKVRLEIYDYIKENLKIENEKINKENKKEFIEYANNNGLDGSLKFYSTRIAFGDDISTLNDFQKQLNKDIKNLYKQWKDEKKYQEFKDSMIVTLSKKEETNEAAFVLKIKDLTKDLFEEQKNEIFNDVINYVDKQVKLYSKINENTNQNTTTDTNSKTGGRK